MAGAPVGNNNATKNKVWSDAIRKAVTQRKDIDRLANALLDKAMDGDIKALKELGDRLEGKVASVVEQTTEHKGSIHTKVELVVVDPAG